MYKFGIGDKVIYNAKGHGLTNLAGVIHSSIEYDEIWRTRWWIFFPDKWYDAADYWNPKDPFLCVCWPVWEDCLIPKDARDGCVEI